jgi:hypothetical protein
MTVISLQDGKYEIERDENGLMVGMWRNGDFWKSGLELFAHAQVFHAALNEIERLRAEPKDSSLAALRDMLQAEVNRLIAAAPRIPAGWFIAETGSGEMVVRGPADGQGSVTLPNSDEGSLPVRLLRALAKALVQGPLTAPIDMILHCPNCGEQHIDAPEPAGPLREDGLPGASWPAWTNPPHRSHLCHGCGHIWRPADVPTNGVAEIKTKGKKESPEPNYETQNEAQGYALEAIHQFVPELRFREDGQTLLTPAQVETILRRMGWKPPGEQRHGQ